MISNPHDWTEDVRPCRISVGTSTHTHAFRCARCGLVREAFAEQALWHYFMYLGADPTRPGIYADDCPPCLPPAA